MIKHSFLIWIVIMIVMGVFHMENKGSYTKPTKEHYIHDTADVPTWKQPKNIKKIKQKYGI